jgi:hypothetical protein
MIQHKQEFPILPSPHAPDYLSEELKKIDGYKNYNCGNRVIEYNEEGKGRPVLGEDGKPITVPRYIIVNGTDDMDKAEVKVTIDKYIADYPAYAEAKQAEYDAQQYARTRAKKYPSWQEQMDMQYHDAVDGTTTWQDAVKAVKDAHPKP